MALILALIFAISVLIGPVAWANPGRVRSVGGLLFLAADDMAGWKVSRGK